MNNGAANLCEYRPRGHLSHVMHPNGTPMAATDAALLAAIAKAVLEDK